MSQPELKRVIGLGGATFLGLGSILGTGVFVSIGVAAGVAGPSVVLAVAIAAAIATCNGMSSAQLAAAHPVSGGTYEYGYKYLSPTLGFGAGWMFLSAKSASAATAALGFSSYLLHVIERGDRTTMVLVALGAVVVLTAVVLGGMRRSNRTNTVIVLITLSALAAFIAIGLPEATSAASKPMPSFFGGGAVGLLEATALMFVAYTGYGRIATLGEEVEEPRRTIPRAIIATLVASAVIYIAIASVAVFAVGAEGLAVATGSLAAPLEAIALGLGHDSIAVYIAIGAITAMLGVLLNLLLGLSRVLLAMGRRGDMPKQVAIIADGTPRIAVLVVGVIIAGLVLIGDVKTTWSFSAFTVLVYYALTNLAALKLPPEARLYPRWISVVGLASCLFVAFWVEPRVWLSGLGVLGVGFAWRLVFRGKISTKS